MMGEVKYKDNGRWVSGLCMHGSKMRLAFCQQWDSRQLHLHDPWDPINSALPRGHGHRSAPAAACLNRWPSWLGSSTCSRRRAAGRLQQAPLTTKGRTVQCFERSNGDDKLKATRQHPCCCQCCCSAIMNVPMLSGHGGQESTAVDLAGMMFFERAQSTTSLTSQRVRASHACDRHRIAGDDGAAAGTQHRACSQQADRPQERRHGWTASASSCCGVMRLQRR